MEAWPIDPLNFHYSRFRGDGKVTIWITGLWRLSDLSDVAFLSFDVGSSYHSFALNIILVNSGYFLQEVYGNVALTSIIL